MIVSHANAKEATIEITVIRADGTRENRGVVAYWHKNPLKRWAWKIKNLLRGDKW